MASQNIGVRILPNASAKAATPASDNAQVHVNGASRLYRTSRSVKPGGGYRVASRSASSLCLIGSDSRIGSMRWPSVRTASTKRSIAGPSRDACSASSPVPHTATTSWNARRSAASSGFG